ncbi:MAG: exo-alpha-sialidase [Acidobacteria bacterium]|nr:exo-alpha-sialidase [Acidobacteriota bacterium]
MNKFLMSMLISVLLFSTLALAQVRELASPAGTGSGQPNLAVSPNGRVYLSWIERLGEGRFSLRFSVLEKEKWSAPQTIAEGSNWFVNWADFPSMIALPDGSLAAHWLAKSGPGTFEYDVTISRSFDGGKTWGKPFVPHRDGVKAEHGFVSLFAAKDGNLAAVWLDGREMKSGEGSGSDHGHGHGNMTLRYVKIKRDGTLTDEAVLDTRVCECCQTSAAMTADGPVVVYRDRSEQEIRDTSIVRLRDGQWSQPVSVFQDGWQINGCPVNGPSIAASGRRVAVAWFTGVNNKPRVKLAFSDDAGASFGEPITVDDGNPAGRVEALLLADGSALVCWLEKIQGGGEVRVRRVKPDGKFDPAMVVSATGAARSNGFPQMVRVGKTLVFAWTGARVLTAISPLKNQ